MCEEEARHWETDKTTIYIYLIRQLCNIFIYLYIYLIFYLKNPTKRSLVFFFFGINTEGKIWNLQEIEMAFEETKRQRLHTMTWWWRPRLIFFFLFIIVFLFFWRKITVLLDGVKGTRILTIERIKHSICCFKL